MSVASPPSSPPTKTFNSFSPLSQNSPRLSSLQLSYRKFPQVLESPSNKSSSNKRHYRQPFIPRPSSLIAPSDGLEAALLAAYNEAKEEAEDFGRDWPDPHPEHAANQAFLNDTSDSDTDESSSDSSLVEESESEDLQESNKSSSTRKNRMSSMSNA